jgi:hypothetical protein
LFRLVGAILQAIEGAIYAVTDALVTGGEVRAVEGPCAAAPSTPAAWLGARPKSKGGKAEERASSSHEARSNRKTQQPVVIPEDRVLRKWSKKRIDWGRTVNGKTYEEARTFMPEHARWILNNSKGGKQFSEGMIDYANYLRVMKKKEEKLLAPSSSSSSNGEEDKDMNPEDWIDEEPTHDKQG